MNTQSIEAAADRLWRAAQSGSTCVPVRDLIGARDTDAAYAVQDLNVKRWLGGEERILSGRKIALTSKADRAGMGASEPVHGALFADAATLYGSDLRGLGTVSGTDMEWRASVGASIIWASPFGPLRVDYAIPVAKEDSDRVQNFNFGVSTRF